MLPTAKGTLEAIQEFLGSIFVANFSSALQGELRNMAVMTGGASASAEPESSELPSNLSFQGTSLQRQPEASEPLSTDLAVPALAVAVSDTSLLPSRVPVGWTANRSATQQTVITHVEVLPASTGTDTVTLEPKM
jgi:hypothetical protein